MATRMTAQRLERLIADGDVDGVRTAVTDSPELLGRTVERDGQGGWTPLHLAVAAGNGELVGLLVGAGADLAARTEDGRTPVHLALECDPGLVPALRTESGPADPAAAAYRDDVDELTARLDDGAPLTDPASGTDLLGWAAAGGAVRSVRLLLDRGADVSGGALAAAAGHGRAEVVGVLLDAGADVDRRDPHTGRAPLHDAVAGEDAAAANEVVRLLLKAGADVSATTPDGASALDIARVAAARHRRADADRAAAWDALAELLVAHGATG